MEKRELQAGKIVGALWLLWKLTTLDPYRLQVYVHTFNRLPMIIRLDLICSTASFLILVLGLMMEKRAIAGIGCLAIIGYDMWVAFRTAPTVSELFGNLQGIRYPFLMEATCFILLFFALFNPEKSKLELVFATALAFFSQFTYALGSANPRARENLSITILGVALYVLAVNATGRYFAGTMPKELYPSSGRNSRRGGASGQEGVWRASGSPNEQQERIRKLKELQDSGIMTKAEYDQMVDKIKKS